MRATASLGTIDWRPLRVPLACVFTAQALQHVFAAIDRPLPGVPQPMTAGILLVSFVKVVAVTLALLYVGRAFLRAEGRWHRADERITDRFMNGVVTLNLAVAAGALLGIATLHSDWFNSLQTVGITRNVGRGVLLLALFAVLAPFNRSVFRDISRAMGSEAADRAHPDAVAMINKRFLTSFAKWGAVYLLPALLVHILLTKGMAGFGPTFLTMAMLDAAVVTGLSLGAGYVMFLAHRETVDADGWQSTR